MAWRRGKRGARRFPCAAGAGQGGACCFRERSVKGAHGHSPSLFASGPGCGARAGQAESQSRRPGRQRRALDQLLASANPKDLQPDSLAHDSVAGQGLSALERLLYEGDDPAASLKAPGKDGAWRTQVGLGMARNLALISRDVLKDWTAPG